MHKSISISIPEPCHENWGNMTPNEKGRFCNACAKTVVDFSVMTDTQVLNYLIDRQEEKVCGRLLPEQLDTPISIAPPAKKKIKWYWNAAAAIALLFAKSETAKAQGAIRTETAPVNKVPDNGIRGKIAVSVARPQNELNGKVVDKDGNPVPFAAVWEKGRSAGVSADADGNFKIKAIPGTVLYVSATTFKNTEFLVGTERNCRIVLQQGEILFLGEVSIVSTRVDKKPLPDKAIFNIKDSETGDPVPGATISITRRSSEQQNIVYAASNGKYNMKDFSRDEDYVIKVIAEGYQSNEFTIASSPGNSRTLLQEILLRKLPVSKDEQPGNIVVAGGLKVSVIKGEVKTTCTEDTTYLSKIEEPLVPGPVPTSVVAIPTEGENNLLRHAVSIYPNPVSRGNAMHIAWVVKQKGPHMVLVYDAAGLLVWQKQETLMPGKIQSSVLMDEKWSSGVYYLRILNPNGKQIAENSFIVQ